MLQPLTSFWVPKAYIVSFKLETDEKLLIVKARRALETYKHHVSMGFNFLIDLFSSSL